MSDEDLRKWCLEEAIRRRDKFGPGHLEVTNVAEDYYLWIKQGRSQSERCVNADEHTPNTIGSTDDEETQ